MNTLIQYTDLTNSQYIVPLNINVKPFTCLSLLYTASELTSALVVTNPEVPIQVSELVTSHSHKNT